MSSTTRIPKAELTGRAASDSLGPTRVVRLSPFSARLSHSGKCGGFMPSHTDERSRACTIQSDLALPRVRAGL